MARNGLRVSEKRRWRKSLYRPQRPNSIISPCHQPVHSIDSVATSTPAGDSASFQHGKEIAYMRKGEADISRGIDRGPGLITAGLLLLCLLITAPVQAANHAPKLSSDHVVASAGFFRLSWQTEARRIELQEANNPNFDNAKTLYRGPDRNSVISGKANGQWFYRVRALDADKPDSQTAVWSDPVTVQVAHHDLSRALMFLSLGALVFIGIVVLILRGEEIAK
jgi:hypothetical protein